MNNDEPVWKRNKKDGLYFINQNFNKRGIEPDTTDFARKNKILWVAIPLIALATICAAIAMFTRSLIVTLPATLASIWLYIFILRKKVWDENMFKRLRSNNSMNKEFGMDGMFNNLLSIDDNTGQWFFQDSDQGLRTAFLVTFDYGSILDQSINANINAIDQAFVPFIKLMHDNNLSFKKYSISIKEKVSVGTLELIRRARMLPDGSWLKLIETLQNETISNLEQNAGSSYKTFYLIYNNDFRNATSFKNLVETIINSSLTNVTSIVNPRICGIDEILTFIVNYYQIDSYDENSIVRNVKHMDISRFFDFISFIDVNGVEYTLNDIIDFNDNNQFFTEEIIDNRANDYAKKLKKQKTEEERQRINNEKRRLNEIMRRQTQHKKMQQMQMKHSNTNGNGLQSSSAGLKPVSFGIAKGSLEAKKINEKNAVLDNKKKQKQQIEERKKQQEMMQKRKQSLIDFNDNTSIDDLLKIQSQIDKEDKNK